MHDAMVQEESGRCSEADGTCGTWLAVPFFVSYLLLTAYVILKMLVAMILEDYVVALKRDKNSLRPDHAEAYVTQWGVLDPRATGHIQLRCLPELIRALPPPLGLDPRGYPYGIIRNTDINQYTYQLDVPFRTNPATGELEVGFTELLACLVRDAYGQTTRLSERGVFAEPSSLRKKIAWDELLPSATSEGSKLLRVLNEKNIVATDGTRASSALDEGESSAGLLRTAIATSVIQRVALKWRARSARNHSSKDLV
jgi:hypothetical protein